MNSRMMMRTLTSARQIAAIDAQQAAAVAAAAPDTPPSRLVQLKGVAATSVSTLLDEGITTLAVPFTTLASYLVVAALVLALPVGGRPVLVQVVEQPPGLVLLHVQAGEPHQVPDGELPPAALRPGAARARHPPAHDPLPKANGAANPKAGAMIWMRIVSPMSANRIQFAYHSCLW